MALQSVEHSILRRFVKFGGIQYTTINKRKAHGINCIDWLGFSKEKDFFGFCFDWKTIAKGIKKLKQTIADEAPSSIKENEIKNYFGEYIFSFVMCWNRTLNTITIIVFVLFECIVAGRKIAIDASMCLYQFLIAVRTEGAQLTSVDGETTSHLMGTFYRTTLKHNIY